MKKVLGYMAFGGVISACVVICTIGTDLGIVRDVAMTFLGVLGLTVISTLIWNVFGMFFDRTNGNDTGLIVAMLGLFLSVLLAIGAIIAVIAGAPVLSALIVVGIIEGLYTIYACWQIS